MESVIIFAVVCNSLAQFSNVHFMRFRGIFGLQANDLFKVIGIRQFALGGQVITGWQGRGAVGGRDSVCR